MRQRLGLQQGAAPISNEELGQLMMKNVKKNDREYTLLAYEKFRDLVCGAGLPLNQVRFALNTSFELFTGGIKGPLTVSRTVVKDAILGLGAADGQKEMQADAGRKHQLIFDESAHILILASSHWNEDLNGPETTVLAAVRLDKQSGQLVASLVHGQTMHIPAASIIGALSDNCGGMDGKYNGAMVCLFRLLRARQLKAWADVDVGDLEATPVLGSSQTCYIDLCNSESESSDSEDSDDEVDSEDEELVFTLKSRAEARSKKALGVAAERLKVEESRRWAGHNRHTRAPCMTHLGSIMHDSAVVAACGKAPPYKSNMVKQNHLLTYLLQQHYIWDANRVSKLLVCEDLCGVKFQHQTTEPDLNRWLYTFFACCDSIDPEFQFKSTLYYLASTTRICCDCDLFVKDGRYSYDREAHCECLREWCSAKGDSKEARQILWFGCLHDPGKGADWQLSTLIRFQLLAEFEFSSKVINPFHHWTIGQESHERARHRSRWAPAATSTPSAWRQLPAGYRLCELSEFVNKVLLECDQMLSALEANCWTHSDVARYQKNLGNCVSLDSPDQPEIEVDTDGVPNTAAVGSSPTISTSQLNGFTMDADAVINIGSKWWGRSTLPSKYEVGQWPAPDPGLGGMFCPLNDTVTIARQCLAASALPGGRTSYRRVKRCVRRWICGYVDSCKHWLPRLQLLPFAIGQLECPVLGPPLARALIRRSWAHRVPMRIGQIFQQPLMYKQFGPWLQADSKADDVVLESIVVQAKAEYHDVVEASTGKKAAREQAAEDAMKNSVQLGCVDTYGLLEAIEQSEEAIQEFYTFAAFGTRPRLHGRICPSISQYPTLNYFMNLHVRSQLVTQQQIEAMFNKYRLAANKRCTDTLKAEILKWKQNVWKRSETYKKLQLVPRVFEHTKMSVLAALKKAKAKLRASMTAAGALARLLPHFGRSKKRKRQGTGGAVERAKGPTKEEKEQAQKLMAEFSSLNVNEFLPKQKRKWLEHSGRWPPAVVPTFVELENPTKKAKKATSKKRKQKVIQLFCICQQEYDDEREYMGCDGCNDWFHRECLRMSTKLFDRLQDTPGPWYCKKCLKQMRGRS